MQEDAQSPEGPKHEAECALSDIGECGVRGVDEGVDEGGTLPAANGKADRRVLLDRRGVADFRWREDGGKVWGD